MTAPALPSPSLHALLTRVVDYAGLFPPANRSMNDAVRAYAEHRASGDAWAMGRFIVPALRLEEFEGTRPELLPVSAAGSWALSALMGADLEFDLACIEAFNERHRDVRCGAVHVDTVELKATHSEEILKAATPLRGRFDAFIEVPVTDDPAALIDAIASAGAKAKIRTGGITANAIPTGEQVVRFIRRCIDRSVAFKATAGLHHPVRAEYALTYAADAPRAVMFGFLNVLLAAAFMRDGLDDANGLLLLEERDATAIVFDRDAVHWHGRTVGADALRAARHEAVAFGSCSFAEPMDGLRTLRLV